MTTIKRGQLTPSPHYTGDAGRQYAATHHSGVKSIAWDIEFEHFRPYLGRADTVLDFGCANGGMLLRVSRNVATAHGLEVNEASREVARANGLRVFGSLSEIPSEQRYERVISNHVLEHVRDVCGTLEAIRGVLQPGGLLVAKLPINDIREPRQRTWSENDKDWHLYTWTPRLFGNLLHEAGYDVLESRIITSAWHRSILPLYRFGLGPLACWAFAVLKARRQVLAVGQNTLRRA
jgi:SAM-dependent methyltransferase